MPLILLGVVLAVIILLERYVYQRLWQQGLSLELGFSAKEAFEGDQLYLWKRLTNKKFLPLPWIYITLNISDGLKYLSYEHDEAQHGAQNSLFSIMGNKSIYRKKPFVCMKRGVYGVYRVYINATNTLHNIHFHTEQRFHAELLVFPKLLDHLDDLDVIFTRLDGSIANNALINPDPFEFRGIRDYQPSDPLKSVNFKASAIAQQLMVNMYAPTSSPKVMLLLNLEGEVTHDVLEMGIKLIATLASHYIQKGVRTAFSTNGRDASTMNVIALPGGVSNGHLYRIFESLARISFGFHPAPMAQYVDELTDITMVYVLVSSHVDDGLIAAFNDAKQRGLDVLLIVPTEDEDMAAHIPRSKDIIPWMIPK